MEHVRQVQQKGRLGMNQRLEKFVIRIELNLRCFLRLKKEVEFNFFLNKTHTNIFADLLLLELEQLCSLSGDLSAKSKKKKLLMNHKTRR